MFTKVDTFSVIIVTTVNEEHPVDQNVDVMKQSILIMSAPKLINIA